MSDLKKIVILGELPEVLFDAKVNLGRGSNGGMWSTWIGNFAIALSKLDLRGLRFYWLNFSGGERSSRISHIGNHVLISIASPVQLKNRMWQSFHYALVGKLVNRILDRIQPKILHCWGTESPYLAILEKSKAFKILSIQGLLKFYKENNALSNISFWKKQAELEKFYIRVADLITCESSWAIDILKKDYYVKEIIKIQYGINNLYFSQKWSPRKSNCNIIFIGRICKGKGVDFIQELAINSTVKSLTIHMVGAGDQIWIDKLKSNKNIKYHGSLSAEKISKLLNEAWALILPTRCDTSANVIKEARVVGLPILTTKNGGHIDYLQFGDKGNSCEIDLDDFSWSVDNVDKFLKKPFNTIISMGRVRHDLDRKELSAEMTAKKFLSLYREHT